MLELECKKAELALKLQRTQATSAALELATLETEEAVRRTKRLAQDDQEEASAAKRRLLNSSVKSSEEDTIKGNQAREIPRDKDEAPKPTTSITKAANDGVLTDDAARMAATTEEADVETTALQTNGRDEVALGGATLAEAALEGSETEEPASGGAEKEEADDAQNEEVEEEETAVEE